MQTKSVRNATWVLALALIWLFCTGTTYYVCDNSTDCNAGDGSGWSTGSDSGGGESRGDPWKTLQYAENNVSAGDFVIVGDGTYDEFEINVHGSAGSPVTFESENLHGACIDGEITTTSPGLDGIEIYRTAHITIKKFEIKRCKRGVALLAVASGDPCEYITLEQLKVHSNGIWYVDDDCNDGGSGPWAGIYSQAATRHFIIRQCKVYDIGRKSRKSDGGACCGDDYFYDHCLYILGTGVTIENNVLYNSWGGWPLKFMGSEFAHSSGIDRLIRNNTFAHKLPQEDIDCQWRGNGTQGHLEFASGGGAYDNGTQVFRNNAIYDPPYDHASWRSGSLADTSFSNLYTSADTLVYEYDGSGTPSSSNVTLAASLASFGFTDADNDDFSLTSESSLIDAGTATGAVTVDIDGNARVGLPDVGAYEYGSSSETPLELPLGELTITSDPLGTGTGDSSPLGQIR
jgi:hypothetical protein